MIGSAIRVDEAVFPRTVGESFLKLITGIMRAETAGDAGDDLGNLNHVPLAVSVRNVGDVTAVFKVRGARRTHPAQHQDGDVSYEDISGLTSVSVVGGGVTALQLDTSKYNLFAFYPIAGNGGQGRLRVAVASSRQVDVWKGTERELEKGTNLDDFLRDETPVEFYANDQAGTITRTISVTTSWAALPDISGSYVTILNQTGADLLVSTAAEGSEDANKITIKDGSTVNFDVFANASEVRIKAAAGASGVNLIVE